jgi:hypothetical protein
MSKTPTTVVVWVVALLFVMPKPVLAYLDPASSSALMQAFIALTGATFGAIVVYRRAMKDWVRRLLRRDSRNDPQV